MSSLKVITCNIEGDKHLEQVISFLHAEQPEIVCLQEVLEKDVERLKHELSMSGEFFPCLTIDQENYTGFPVGSIWGMLLLTNLFEFTISVKYYVKHADSLPKFGYKNPNAANRILAVIEGKKENVSYRIISTHFTWTPDGNSSELQHENLQTMFNLLQSYQDFILCGDFNAPRGGEIWDILASKFTDNIPADVTSTLDPEIHRAKGIELVVDGMFSTPEYMLSDVRVVGGVSDHKAIIATISK